MANLAVKVPVYEYERGWGNKLDDHMVCLTKEDAENFVKEFNSKNTSATIPDWYMVAENNIQPIDLTDEQMKLVEDSENKRMWLQALK